MTINVQVKRNAGHPWDGRAGFDQMTIKAASKCELDAAGAAAERKYWRAWILGAREDGLPVGVFYKPCGHYGRWEGAPSNRHPGKTLDCTKHSQEP